MLVTWPCVVAEPLAVAPADPKSRAARSITGRSGLGSGSGAV
jgi:hypothetical protein